MLEAAQRSLPQSFKDALLARAYNLLTGSNLTHYDVARLSVFERDELIGIVNNADLAE